MSTIGMRIKEIRETEGLGRTKFAELLGVSMRTIQGIEQRGSSPRQEVMEAIANHWPQYSYWLLTGKTMPEQGQINPATEKARKDSDGAAEAS
ncbi:helix-turn-helix domain-containing protein [Arhodomonas sp. SL1]|uniref:helix-turn-helix domain-containing protein n=1 Tax=Arhodomonas sp. SL1 TaxID=3425691 RepID=UPI003F884771